MSILEQMLSQFNIISRTDCTFAELTTFKVGGPIERVFYPETAEQCAAIVKCAKAMNKTLVFMGNGSNILGTDRGMEAWVIKTDALNTLEVDDNGIVTVGAGVKNVKVSSFALKKGLTGLEFAHGIPGSIGGAVAMNAGAYGGTMDQVILRTHYIDDNGNLAVIEGKEHNFGYRKSFFIQNPSFLIIKTELQLQKGSRESIQATIDDLQQRRKDKQPLEYPSAGSTFKRPAGYFAGKLIEDCNLKGCCIGDAQVSEKHAGFIINRGSASATDVRNLIDYVKKTVFERFGVKLECEVRFLGDE